MDEVLCLSIENETSLIFNDNYISDDEELLPIDSYKLREQLKTVESIDNTINHNSVVNSFTKIEQKYYSNSEQLSKVSEEKVELNSNSIDINIDYNNKSVNRSIYYTECPVCDSCGPKTINHIKQCAQKHSIDPKRVVTLLKGCKKTDVSVDVQKRKNLKSNPKQVKKSNKKLNNNYVISFEAEKPLKLSINPKLICDKRSVNNTMNYELSVLDIKERKVLLESKISDQIICNVVNNFANKEDIDRVLVPNFWSLASLQSQTNDYVVQDFEKYVNNNKS